MPNKFANCKEYLPAEDTFFLADHIIGQTGTSALDVGSGSGYLTKLLQENFSFVIGTDINLNVLQNQTYKTKNLICCHGADALNNKFDLIVCNLPYLATDEITDVATDGGKGGLIATASIIDTILPRLNPKGKFLFITSSLSDYKKLLQYCRGLGMYASIIAKKKLFFEELLLVEARVNVEGNTK